MAKRSYPTFEGRGSGQECQAVTGQELPRGATPRPMPGVAARRSNPMPEARGSSREEQPHIQGVVAAWAQEGLEELSHVEGQEGVDSLEQTLILGGIGGRRRRG